MATLERTYNVPLRKEFQKAPKYRRAKKALVALRQFLLKHMKTDRVIIGSHLNQKIWERGLKKPPHHVKVTAIKDEKGIVTAELFGAPKPIAKEAKPKKTEEKVQKETEELKEALSGELKKTEEIVKENETKVEEKPKTAKPKEVPKAEKKAEPKKPAAEKKAPAKKAPKKEAEKKTD